LSARGEVRINHQDVVAKDDPTVVAMAIAAEVTFVEVDIRIDFLNDIHFGANERHGEQRGKSKNLNAVKREGHALIADKTN
jgi:hypothetical protein